MNNKLFTKPTGFGQIIDGTVARCPEREAIVYKGWRITYGEMVSSSTRLRTICARSVLQRAADCPSFRETAPNAF